MSPSDFYVSTLSEKLAYKANWLPSEPLSLGDVGIFDGIYFKRITSLGKLGIVFETRASEHQVDFSYQSQVTLDVKAEGNVALDAAGTKLKSNLSISFGGKGAFVFEAANCIIAEISDKHQLASDINQLYMTDKSKWELNYVVVDTVVTAGSATILLSNSSNSNLELSGSGKLSFVSLTDPKLGIKIKSQSGEITKFWAKQGLTPLFRTSKLKAKILGSLFGSAGGFKLRGPKEDSTGMGKPVESPWEQI